MPYTTELTEDFMGIVQVGSGAVTGREILDGCKSVTALVQTTENFHYKLVDFSAATELRITPEEMQDIVEEDRRIAFARPHIAVALVVPNDQIEVQVKEWERVVMDLGWGTHVARKRSDALKWLRRNSATAPVES